MTDAELQAYWPDLGTVVAELRRAGHVAAADRLVDAVIAGATSGEILDGVAVALREHRALRSGLGAAGARAWDAVMDDVHRAYPGSRLGHWLARLVGRGRA